MVSAKFTNRPPPRKVPCIIHPPPPPEPIVPATIMPPQLSGWGLWRDLYAPEFWQVTAYIDLFTADYGLTYEGQSENNGKILGLHMQAITFPSLWNVTLFTGLPGLPPGDFTWYNVQVDPGKPFDSGHLQHDNPSSPPDLFLLACRILL
jgi:hypothetical protein